MPKLASTAGTRNPEGQDSTAGLAGGRRRGASPAWTSAAIYALIIGNQNYDMLESLKTPRYDAERAAKILKDKYGFTVQVIEDGNDVAILKALNDLNTVLGPNDNLLIYYAGHGYRLKTDKTREWLLAAAQCRAPAE